MMDKILSQSISNNQVQSLIVPKNGQNQVMSSSELLHKNVNELSISDAALRRALEKVNKILQGNDTRMEYSIHESTGDVIVKVINEETQEIVREVPSEKIVDLIAKLEELSGLIIDEKR